MLKDLSDFSPPKTLPPPETEIALLTLGDRNFYMLPFSEGICCPPPLSDEGYSRVLVEGSGFLRVGAPI